MKKFIFSFSFFLSLIVFYTPSSAFYKQFKQALLFQNMLHSLGYPIIWAEADYNGSIFENQIHQMLSKKSIRIIHGCLFEESIPSLVWQVNRGIFSGFISFESMNEETKKRCTKKTKEILNIIFQTLYFIKIPPLIEQENSIIDWPKELYSEIINCSQVVFKKNYPFKISKNKLKAIIGHHSDYELFCSFHVFDKQGKEGAELIAGTYIIYAQPQKCVFISRKEGLILESPQ